MLRFSFLIVFAAIAQQMCAKGLAQSDAAQRLKSAGVTIPKLCTNDSSNQCTSLEGIREDTITGVTNLKIGSGCPISIVGGTEPGFPTDGRYTHEKGYIVNIHQNSCINYYIIYNLDCVRVEDVSICEDASGNNYAYTGNTWILTFYNPKDANMTKEISG